jgi:SSS family solute:Na+ symporter
VLVSFAPSATPLGEEHRELVQLFAWGGVVLLLLVLARLSARFSRVESSDDFLLMGRGVGFWLFFGAYTGAAIGGASSAGVAGYGYAEGISSFWILLVSGFTVPLFAWLFGGPLNRFGREMKAFTLADFLVHRYGESVRRPAMVITYLRPAFITGLQFLAIGLLLQVGFGLDKSMGILLGAAIVLGYTLVGGQYSAITSQWLQALLQGLGMLLFLVFAVALHGGIGEAADAMVTHLPPEFLDVYAMDFSVMSVWLISFGIFYFVDPWLFQWAYMAKDPRTSRNALVAAAVASPWGACSCLGGMLIMAAVTSGRLHFPEGIESDQIYLSFIQNHIGVGGAALLLVAFLMTVLSCASSFLMNGATILKSDLLDSVLAEETVQQRPVLVGRMAILGTAVFGIVAALWVPVLVPLWLIGQSIVVSGLFWPVLAAWFWPRATGPGALLAIIVGGLSSFGWALWAWHDQGSASALVFGLHAVHVGMASSLVAMIGGSLATQPATPEAIETTSWRRLWRSESAEGASA